MKIVFLALLAILFLSSASQANEITIQLKCPKCAAEGIVGYTVKLGITQGGPWDLLTRTYPIIPPDSNGVVTLPLNADLPPGTYYDIIEAYNLDTQSPPSNERTIIVPSPVEQLLPTALTALLWMRGTA